jgi:hypothetical protein
VGRGARAVNGPPLIHTYIHTTPSANTVDPAPLTSELRQRVARLRPVPAARPDSVYILAQRHREVHPRLPPSGSNVLGLGGPYQVLSQRDKTLQLLIRGRPVTMSADRVKPAYILHETNCGNNTKTSAPATRAIAPPGTPPQPCTKRTCFGCHIHFPFRFNIGPTISAGVGGLMWESPTVPNRRSLLLQYYTDILTPH